MTIPVKLIIMPLTMINNQIMSGESTAAWIGSLAATIGLFFTGWQLRGNNKETQLQVAEKLFSDIKQLEADLYAIPKDESAKVKHWQVLFLNQLEWAAFLINHKKIKDIELRQFFEMAMKDWYNQIYLTYLDRKESDFEELQKWYKQFKK
jgi:hypothetical protein